MIDLRVEKTVKAGLGLVLRYAHFSVEDLNPALDAAERRWKSAAACTTTVNEKVDFR